MADLKGNLSKAKANVLFTEEAPNRTRVTVTWEPHGTVTAEGLEVFMKARGGMTMGWTGSFDKLETVLENT